MGTRVGDSQEGMYVRSNLQELFEYIHELNLPVTVRHGAYRKLMEVLEELKELPDETLLSQQQATAIRDGIEQIRETLEAELKGVEAYTVTPKRYDVGLLIENVGALLAPGVYEKLPNMAKFDLREAGKCLAFERPTATAFHLMRATEGILRAFYANLVKRGRTETLWGPIVSDLRKRRAARSYAILLDNLDNIRRSFRNPTQHPEATYDIEQVQDLWGLCTDAINRMACALPDLV